MAASTCAALLIAEDEVGLWTCTATTNLSHSKHEDFGDSSSTLQSQHALRHLALTIFSRIFFYVPRVRS
jgi:hypothetical protein